MQEGSPEKKIPAQAVSEKKKFVLVENSPPPPPPITLLMVRPLEIWNQESGMRNSQPFQMSPVGGYCIFLYFFLAEAQFAL